MALWSDLKLPRMQTVVCRTTDPQRSQTLLYLEFRNILVSTELCWNILLQTFVNVCELYVSFVYCFFIILRHNNKIKMELLLPELKC